MILKLFIFIYLSAASAMRLFNSPCSLLPHIMKDAKRHQRSISIAAIDLQNSFGELDHSMIKQSLESFSVLSSAINLFANIYSDLEDYSGCKHRENKTFGRGKRSSPGSSMLASIFLHLLQLPSENNLSKKLQSTGLPLGTR